MRVEKISDVTEEVTIVVTDKAIKKEKKSVGRKLQGLSKATNRITFYVDDEQLEYLISLVNYKEKLSTPSAVAKKLFLTDYYLHGNK